MIDPNKAWGGKILSLRTLTRLRCSGKICVGMNCASKAPNPMQLVFRLSYLLHDEWMVKSQGSRKQQIMCLDC